VILLVDNYDSFTYNLFQLLSMLKAEVHVLRNDQFTTSDVRSLAPRGIVISPGPGEPSGAGLSQPLVRELGKDTPVLGVCLGLQCAGSAFGARVVRADRLMHGKTSRVFHDGIGLFSGIPSPFEAVRYHSLAVERTSIPECLEVTAEADDGTVMGLRHREYPIEGVQFHPESVLTKDGPKLVANFLRACGEV
jgi:anthranilate synthase/aminodeoxychorismate synthase-like glutamine amidotransferase